MMASLYYYRFGGFPPASKYLGKIWQSQSHKRHRKKLKNAKGKLDLTPPRHMSTNIQMNRLHVEQQRQEEIDKQNLVIVEKLSEIKSSPARVDHVNKTWKPSNNRLKKFRERRDRKIEHENKLLAERLQNTGSYYSAEEWEKDYKRHLYFLSIMENTTKDYDEVEDEDDDFKEYTDEDEDDNVNDSLPPVPPGTPSPTYNNKKPGNTDEKDVSLPSIDEKGKKDEKKKKKGNTNYSEQAAATMDADEIRTAIEENNKEKVLRILWKTLEKDKLRKLCEKYKEMYDKDLMEDVESIADEEAQQLLKSLSFDPATEDAKRLNEAMKGLGTDEDTIIEILCTRNNKELAAIRKDYQKQFDTPLEEDLKGDTSGDVEKLLVELSRGQRKETEKADENVAKKDAKTLIEAGIDNWGTNEGDFIRIFTQRSLPQLATMYDQYKKMAKMEIEESIDKEMDGNLQEAFLAIVKSSRDPSIVLEDKIIKAIEDGNTGTVAIIILPMKKARVYDLGLSYKNRTKKDLAGDIKKKCNGDLKEMLMAKLDDVKENEKYKKTDKKGKVKDRDRLPPVRSKSNQQKKKEEEKNGEKKKERVRKKDKRQDKKSEGDKKADDASEKDADDLHQAIQGKDKEKIIDILAKNCIDHKKTQKLQDQYKKDNDEEILDALKSVLDDDDLQDPLDCLFTPIAEYEAEVLHDAIKGLGTNENALIEILCTRSNKELADIQAAYKKKYENSLESDLKGDANKYFEDMLIKLLKGSRDDSDKVDEALSTKEAGYLLKAFEMQREFGTALDVIISILTERNYAQLNATFAEYKKLSKVEIEESIEPLEKELTKDLKKAFLFLLKSIRNSDGQQSSKLLVSMETGDVNTVAKLIILAEKGELTKIMNSYKTTTKKNLEDEISKKCSGNLKKLLLAKMGQGKERQQQMSKGKDISYKDKGKAAIKPSPTKKQVDVGKSMKENDASQLRNFIKANNKKKIKDIVVQNAINKPKLKKLADNYKKEYAQDLFEELESTIDGDLVEAVAATLLPSSEADARSLKLTMKGAETDESVLIEILCTKTNTEIDALKKDYQKKYEKSLEEAVRSETSGHFENLLIAILQGKREESTTVSDDQAHKDAETLIEVKVNNSLSQMIKK